MSLIAPLDRTGRPAPLRVKRPGDRRSASRSAARALDLLELFGEEQRPLRAIEIARALAMHPSTANQLLKTLVDSAHLQFDARAMSYRPAPRLLGFARWAVAEYDADGWLHDLVRAVAAETGLVVTLTTPNDLFMQVIDSVRPERLSVERGQRVSIFGSAVGSAYLSTLPDPEVERLADRARIARTEIGRLLAKLIDIRRDGFADGAADAMWSIAVPIAQSRLPFPVVLGLSGFEAEVRDRRDMLQRLMHEAIERLAR